MRKEIKLAALAAIGALLACSCVKEITEEPKQYTPESGVISFVLNGISTRADSETPIQTYTYNLGADDHGHAFSLNETVTWMEDLGAASPTTRGTPVYTENVQDVYGNAFSGIIYSTGTTPSVVVGDGEFELQSDGKRWRRVFDADPWLQSDPLTFFLRMPVAATGLTGLAYSGSSIAFDYATPATAAEQQDIVFASRTITKADYEAELTSNGGADLLFRHALTGVKFAIGNNTTTEDREPDGEVQTFITKVVIKGLKDKGHAVFTPDVTGEQNKDDKDIYSSQTSFVWTDVEGTTRTTAFSQEFSANDIQDFVYEDAGDKVGGPESFYAAGQNRNLNKDDASLTFWFIPQAITADLKMEVTFYVWDGQGKGEDQTLTLDMGTLILAQTSSTNKEWKAGQLRTFTLDPTTVDVDITDEVEGDTKSDVKIWNTGNKNAYIRVAIVGNWIDKSTGDILMGTVVDDGATGTFVPFIAWSETDTEQGTFAGLPGPNWVKNEDDGFWYYKYEVLPGKEPGETATGGTANRLFETYKIKLEATPIEGAGFKMDLVVQAVDAARGADYQAAWASVL